MLQEVLDEVRVDPGLIAADSKRKPKAPGMKYRHYAPKAELLLVEGDSTKVVDEINRLCELAVREGKSVGILATEETKGCYPKGEVLCIGSRKDEDSIGRHLFGILREFDRMQVDVIYSESFSDARFGQAIMNRLLKAAGHHVLEV